MSSRIMQAVVLICDGCGVEVGGDGRFRSAVEARAAAYGEGWRFPNAVGATGKMGTRTHDVCHKCIADWTPRESVGNSGGRYRRVGEVR